MKEFNDCSTSSLLLSCQMYNLAKNECSEANKNLKLSFAILVVSIFIIVTKIFNFPPGSGLMQSNIVSGMVFLSFLGGLLTSLWNYKEFRLKNRLEKSHRDRIYTDYRIYMIENDKVWFDIDGKIKSVKAAEIDDDFVKALLSCYGENSN